MGLGEWGWVWFGARAGGWHLVSGDRERLGRCGGLGFKVQVPILIKQRPCLPAVPCISAQFCGKVPGNWEDAKSSFKFQIPF